MYQSTKVFFGLYTLHSTNPDFEIFIKSDYLRSSIKIMYERKMLVTFFFDTPM